MFGPAIALKRLNARKTVRISNPFLASAASNVGLNDAPEHFLITKRSPTTGRGIWATGLRGETLAQQAFALLGALAALRVLVRLPNGYRGKPRPNR